MNIKSIKEVVNNDALPDSVKEQIIIRILANDKKVIPTILEILENERSETHELLLDTNLELSRAFILLEDPNLGKKKPKPRIELTFVTGEIRKHYLKWQDRIKCCFKIEGLP